MRISLWNIYCPDAFNVTPCTVSPMPWAAACNMLPIEPSQCCWEKQQQQRRRWSNPAALWLLLSYQWPLPSWLCLNQSQRLSPKLPSLPSHVSFSAVWGKWGKKLGGAAENVHLHPTSEYRADNMMMIDDGASFFHYSAYYYFFYHQYYEMS